MQAPGQHKLQRPAQLTNCNANLFTPPCCDIVEKAITVVSELDLSCTACMPATLGPPGRAAGKRRSAWETEGPRNISFGLVYQAIRMAGGKKKSGAVSGSTANGFPSSSGGKRKGGSASHENGAAHGNGNGNGASTTGASPTQATLFSSSQFWAAAGAELPASVFDQEFEGPHPGPEASLTVEGREGLCMLLEAFAARINGDAACKLVFSSSLGKTKRALIRSLVQERFEAQLECMSYGEGEQRALNIFSKGCAPAALSRELSAEEHDTVGGWVVGGGWVGGTRRLAWWVTVPDWVGRLGSRWRWVG